VLGQLLAHLIERLQDVVAVGILEQGDVEAVFPFQYGGDRLGIGDRRRELRQLGIGVVADYQCIVFAEIEIQGRQRRLVIGRRSGRGAGRALRSVCGFSMNSKVARLPT
jgi:hypothetical protein